ncbi:uncharacterized protein LOC125112841 [Phacochoerus africanus]|uniref:uncharacterized protein LOC125112841 n=1 Tax=Phacochoerus africanus TaxID=41426 RepID=UPI001FD8BE0E|nr:uncharacterized protein LOC125112841 [Phacochoerus africanus]
MGPSPPPPRRMATAGPCGVVLTRSRPAQAVRGGAERVARAPARSFAGSVRRRRLRGNIFSQVLMDPETVDGTPPVPCSRVWPGRVHLGLRRAHVGSRSLDKTSFPTLSFPTPSECFPVGRSGGGDRPELDAVSWILGSQVPIWSSGQTDTCPRGQAGKGSPGWPAGSTSFLSLSLSLSLSPFLAVTLSGSTRWP